MTPQSNFMVIAPVRPHAVGRLREVLATMTSLPGTADPQNVLFPFGQFSGLHFARFVVLDDQTLDDRERCGLHKDGLPVYLAFLGDCDGPADELLAEFVRVASEGLRQIFGNCEAFDPGTDLLGWLRRHSVAPAAQYVNWVGRSVEQIEQEAALHAALARARFDGRPDDLPSDTHRRLCAAVRASGFRLTPRRAMPLVWRIQEWLHLLGSLLLLLILTPFLIIYAPVFLLQLRARETSDIVIAPPPYPAHIKTLSAIEDRDVSNQFSAFGSVKPGRFRKWTLTFLLWILGVTTRHLYTRGHLARVVTIHFARWVFLDGGRRVFFASNYDGSLPSYMDDFINKVAFGLNLVFSNGIGYPRTNYLIFDGAKDEQAFKFYIRRHQLPTEVWYRAYPGLTTVDIAGNARIRDGFDRSSMPHEDARRWLAMI